MEIDLFLKKKKASQKNFRWIIIIIIYYSLEGMKFDVAASGFQFEPQPTSYFSFPF